MAKTNKELVRKTRELFKEHGHDIPLGQIYAVLSQLAGFKNFQAAKASGADLAKVIEQLNPKSSPLTSPETNERQRKFEITISLPVICEKTFHLSAQSGRQAERIIQEYKSYICGDAAPTGLSAEALELVKIHGKKDFDDKHWAPFMVDSYEDFEIERICEISSEQNDPSLTNNESIKSHRFKDFGTKDLVVQRAADGFLETNVLQQKVVHSVNGFEIGYSGSGPADFAYNILLHYGASETFANIFHQDFKREFVARMDQRLGTRIPQLTILEWIDRHKSETA